MLNGAAAIHYTTQAEKELAEESLGLTRGAVVPLGIETELLNGNEVHKEVEAKALSSVKAPYVLVMSRLHQKKGLEVLLPAFLSLVKKPEFAKWHLVLAGEGEPSYVALLKHLVKSGGGNGNVVFTGWLDGARRKDTLRDASLLALTSYQENFGLCAVEALACGVPVLLSPHVNLAQEIETAGAGWISAVDDKALRETLTLALHDHNELIRRGAAGRVLALRFDWHNVAGMLAQLYETLQRGETGNA